MQPTPLKLSGKEIAIRWDGMDFMARLNLIMEYRGIFLEHHLISPSELDVVDAMHESAREYILLREDQPIFTSLNLKQSLAAQIHRDKLKAALEAVFS